MHLSSTEQYTLTLCIILCVVVPVTLSFSNNNYNPIILDYNGSAMEEFRGDNGTLVKSVSQTRLVSAQDVKCSQEKVYISGYHYSIQIYNESTNQYIRQLHYYPGYVTTRMNFIENETLLAVVLMSDRNSSDYRISILNLSTGDEAFNFPCPVACYDVIQRPDNKKLLVATSTTVDQYSITGNQYTREGIYFSYTPIPSQTFVQLQWASDGYLYVGYGTSGKIYKYLPNAVVAISQGLYVDQFFADWTIVSFMFYPNETNRLLICGTRSATSQSAIFKKTQSLSQTIALISDTGADSNYFGMPLGMTLDSNLNILVTDVTHVSRYYGNTGAYFGQIIEKGGFELPVGAAVNPQDSHYIYVTTENQILKFDRLNGSYLQTFIPEWDAGLGGILNVFRLLWVNNTLYGTSFYGLKGYNTNGVVAVTANIYLTAMYDVKLSPKNQKLYTTGLFTFNLYQINPVTGNVEANISIPMYAATIAFSADGNTLYCMNSTHLAIIDTGNWTVLKYHIVFFYFPYDIERGPDNNMYLTTYNGTHAVNVTLTSISTIGTLVSNRTNYRSTYGLNDLIFAPAVCPNDCNGGICGDYGGSCSNCINGNTGNFCEIPPSPSPSPTPSRTPSASVSSTVTPSVSPTPAIPSTTPSTTASTTPSTTSSASPSPSVSPSQDTNNASKSNNNDNLPIILGASIGGAIILSSLICGAVFYSRKSKKPPPMDDTELQHSMYRTSSVLTISPDSASEMWNQYWEIDYSEIIFGKEIGRGAYGCVFRAEWRNSAVAVKQLQGKNLSDDAIETFLAEANIVKQLRAHRNVCIIFGVCTKPENPICIVMEFCSGGNLKSVLEKGKINVNLQNLVKIAKDVTSGMAHVHRENFIHCDLACRNLLVSMEGESSFTIKISDFGLARRLVSGEMEAAKDDAFPIRWTAPEVLIHRKLTRACDVWAFGVVLWEILEGDVPYDGQTNDQVVQFISNGYVLPKPINSEYPPEMYAIMKECWKFEPAERPTFNELYEVFKKMIPDSEEMEFGSQAVHNPQYATVNSLYGNNPNSNS